MSLSKSAVNTTATSVADTPSKSLKRLSSFEIRAFHFGILNAWWSPRVYARHKRPSVFVHAHSSAYTLTHYTYTLAPTIAWEYALYRAYGDV